MCDPELITKATAGAPGTPAAGRSTVRAAQPGLAKSQKDALALDGMDPEAIYTALRDRILATDYEISSDSGIDSLSTDGLGVKMRAQLRKNAGYIANYNANRPLQASKSPYGAGSKPRVGAGGFSAGGGGGGGGGGGVPGALLGGTTLLGS